MEEKQLEWWGHLLRREAYWKNKERLETERTQINLGWRDSKNTTEKQQRIGRSEEDGKKGENRKNLTIAKKEKKYSYTFKK